MHDPPDSSPTLNLSSSPPAGVEVDDEWALAREAYKAYGESTHNLNYQGKAMPAWDDLPDSIQKAWHAAASRVAGLALAGLPR